MPGEDENRIYNFLLNRISFYFGFPHFFNH